MSAKISGNASPAHFAAKKNIELLFLGSPASSRTTEQREGSEGPRSGALIVALTIASAIGFALNNVMLKSIPVLKYGCPLNALHLSI